MAAQKKPSVREVLWRKKRARDQMLDEVGKLCDEAWAVFEKVASDRSSGTNDAVAAREIGLRLRSLAYLIEGEHYIDRIAFELQTKDAYMTASEVARSSMEDSANGTMKSCVMSTAHRWRNPWRRSARL